MRTIAISNRNRSNNIRQIIDQVKTAPHDKIIVFTRHPETVESGVLNDCVDVKSVPDGVDASTSPKFINWMLRELRPQGGWLHVIDDSIEILKDPSQFMSDVEAMMTALDINNYFGTVTDVCNKVYNKYNPRLKLNIDKEEYKNLRFGKSLLFCSHSNIHWMTYCLDKADDNELFFDEDFTVDMFFIIEFLARRRNSHPGSLYYMNQYATCESEHGLYRLKSGLEKPERPDINEAMRREDALFKSKNIDYHPDNNIDAVLENVYMKLKTKISS